MSIVRLRLGATVVVGMCAVFAQTAALGAEKQHIAEYYEVDASIQPDGSLEVDEAITFRFIGDEYTYVTREVPAANTDGIEILGATMDGRALVWGDDEGEIEVDYGRRRVELRWRFAPTRDNARHVFGLRYRLKGVVRKGVGEDWMAWAPFPRKFDYAIVLGRVFLRWQPNMSLRRQSHIDGPVRVSAPIENGVAIDVSGYDEGQDDLIVTARFASGAFVGPEPQWQRDEARASEMGPSFIAGAFMILAATGLALFIFFLNYRRDRTDALAPGHTLSEPPEALPPALAGLIHSGRVAVTGTQALATVFDLAGRGAITIQEQPAAGVFKSTRFEVAPGRDLPLAPHEQVVRDTLLGADEHRLDKAMRSLATKPGPFKKAMMQELGALGYLDADRADAGKGMIVAGICVLVFAIAIFVVIISTNMRLGRASLLVPLGFFISSLIMMIVGGTFSSLSTRGWKAAQRWNAYQRHLKEQARQHRLPESADEVSRLLPYATALGVAPSWLKALKQMPGATVPPWLATLGPAGPNAAYVALLASSVSASSPGGGGGGGGVAGGGASSAG